MASACEARTACEPPRPAAGLAIDIREMPQSTRTAAEAAAACGCSVAQIVKSLIFRKAASGEPVLLLVSGKNRVDEKAVEARDRRHARSASTPIDGARADRLRDRRRRAARLADAAPDLHGRRPAWPSTVCVGGGRGADRRFRGRSRRRSPQRPGASIIKRRPEARRSSVRQDDPRIAGAVRLAPDCRAFCALLGCRRMQPCEAGRPRLLTASVPWIA